MPPGAGRREYKCLECGRGYLRSSHLQRHRAIHTTAQRKECPFCLRQFMRSDVMLRHSRACKHKDTQAAQRGQKRGRKRTSCDQCSRTHRMCDGDHPCEACLAASVECSYDGLSRSSLSPSICIQRRSTEPLTSVSNIEQESTKASERIKIPFILNYTDQSSKSSFDLHCMLGGESSSFANADPFPELWSSLFHAFINPSAIESQRHNSTSYYGLDDCVELSHTIARLVSHFERWNTERPDLQQLDISAAKSFFCATRLGDYVHSFFDHASHTNCIIHRASFNVNTVSTHLLLVVSLLGAVCISPEDAVAAQPFSDIVYLSLFDGPEFQAILYGRNPPRSKQNIQLVQAAMLMLVLQSAREEYGINKRIRTQAFPAMVSVVRSLGLTRVMNDTRASGQSTDLEDFIHRETLVRMMAWAYLLDCYSVVFYRSPPHFKLLEANFGLPQNDQLFDMMDPLEYEISVQNLDVNSPPTSLKTIVQRLMDDKPIHPNELLQHINTLFAVSLVLAALHCILFDIQSLVGCINALDALKPIERALDRWKGLYDMFETDLKYSKPVKAGFMIHSLEFWWLAKQSIRRPDVALNDQRFAADSIKSFHSMIQEMKDCNTDI